MTQPLRFVSLTLTLFALLVSCAQASEPHYSEDWWRTQPLISVPSYALQSCGHPGQSWKRWVSGSPCQSPRLISVEDPEHHYALVEARTVARPNRPSQHRVITTTLAVQSSAGVLADSERHVSPAIPNWQASATRAVVSHLALVDVTEGAVLQSWSSKSQVRAKSVVIERHGGIVKAQLRVFADRDATPELRSACKSQRPLCVARWRPETRTRRGDFITATFWAPSRVDARSARVRYDLLSSLHVRAAHIVKDEAAAVGYRVEARRVSLRAEDAPRLPWRPLTTLVAENVRGRVKLAEEHYSRADRELKLTQDRIERVLGYELGEGDTVLAVVETDYADPWLRSFERCKCSARAPLYSRSVAVEQTARGFALRWHGLTISPDGHRLAERVWLYVKRSPFHFVARGYATDWRTHWAG